MLEIYEASLVDFTIFFIIIEVENYGWYMVYNKSDVGNDPNKIDV